MDAEKSVNMATDLFAEAVSSGISYDLANDTNTSMTPDEWAWESIPWVWSDVFQLLLAIIGIVGNFLVIVVLLRRPCRSHCSTDVLIANLAVADFLTSIAIIPGAKIVNLPNTPAGAFYCRVVHSSVFMWIFICASIFSLTTISVERLMAVRFPFTFQRFFSPRSTLYIIAVIWTFSFLINTQSFYVTFVHNSTCHVEFPTAPFQRFIGVSMFLVEYLLPVCLMIGAHVLTIRGISKHARNLSMAGKKMKQQRQDLKLLRAQRRVTEMLFIVVITFIACWTPDQIGYLAFNLGLIDFSFLYSPLYRSFVVLAFFNSCVNPIIYAARNPNFRRALRELGGTVRSSNAVHSVFAHIDDMRNGTSSMDKIGMPSKDLTTEDV